MDFQIKVHVRSQCVQLSALLPTPDPSNPAGRLTSVRMEQHNVNIGAAPECIRDTLRSCSLYALGHYTHLPLLFSETFVPEITFRLLVQERLHYHTLWVWRVMGFDCREVLEEEGKKVIFSPKSPFAALMARGGKMKQGYWIFTHTHMCHIW